MTHRLAITLLAALAGLASCAGHGGSMLAGPEVLHVVLVKLKNPNDAGALIKDTEAALGHSGNLRTLTPGKPLDLGRPEVDGQYDTAFVMEFQDQNAYQRYLVSPEHVRLVSTWKPNVSAMRIFDMKRP